MLTLNNVVRFGAVALVLAAFVVSADQASARPKFATAATEKYPELAKKHGMNDKLTCAMCHPDKDKKKRNNYGAAVGSHLTKKNESDLDKIKEALTKAEADKSATEGKTFGDLIKAGELPGTNEVAN